MAMMLFNKTMSVASKMYCRSLGAKLNAAGLQYEDLLLEVDDVKKAVARLPSDLRIDRDRRIKRAFDASAKRKDCPEEMYSKDPFSGYLAKNLELAEAERVEREVIQG